MVSDKVTRLWKPYKEDMPEADLGLLQDGVLCDNS